jgi:predicted hydrocarbon binding protein
MHTLGNALETTSVPAYSVRQQTEPQNEHPKIITAFMYIPKKSYFLLNLDLRNRLGDVAAVSNILAEAKIEILTGSFTRGSGGKPGIWQIFVQPLDSKITAEEVKRLLLSCPDVIGCQIKESREGLLVDSVTFPIKISSGQRAMIMRNDVWNSMLQRTREKFGSGGDVIIYEQGNMAGRMTGKELLGALGKNFLTQQLDQVIAMYQALGWGKARILSFNQSPLTLVIRMWDSAECMGQKSEKPTGHFIRGHIVGVVEEMFGIECKCAETNCLARGNPCCEFVLEEKPRGLSK